MLSVVLVYIWCLAGCRACWKCTAQSRQLNELLLPIADMCKAHAGTRGALDVIEIPSHFMQNFMNDPGVVGKFARHHSTGDAVPAGLVETTLQDSQLFGALDMETQVRLWRPAVLSKITNAHSVDLQKHLCLAVMYRLCMSTSDTGLRLSWFWFGLADLPFHDGSAVSRCQSS